MADKNAAGSQQTPAEQKAVERGAKVHNAVERTAKDATHGIEHGANKAGKAITGATTDVKHGADAAGDFFRGVFWRNNPTTS